MADFMFFLVATITVLTVASCQLETKRNRSNNKVSTDAIAESKLVKEILKQENQHNRRGDEVMSKLDKYASDIKFETVLLKTKEISKYKNFLQRMNDVVNLVNDKRGHKHEKPDCDRSTGTSFQNAFLPSPNKAETQSRFRLENKAEKSATTTITNGHLNDDSGTFGTRLVFPFQVAVVVSKPKGPNKHAVILVPLKPDMTVLDAFVAATRKYIDNSEAKAEDIPFNVVLDWDDELHCYVVVKAVGIENKRDKAWFFTVKNGMKKTLYSDRCLPDDDVILRPFSSVQLAYRHIRRKSN